MFSANRPDRDDRRKLGSYWAVRGSRGEYWLMVAMATGLSLLLPKLGPGGSSGVMLVFTIRRLHDFNRTGWWAGLPFALGVVGGLALVAAPLLALPLEAGLIVAAVMFTAFVGLMPGDPGPNRFGDPPQSLFGRKKPPKLSETFS